MFPLYEMADIYQVYDVFLIKLFACREKSPAYGIVTFQVLQAFRRTTL